MSLRPLSSLRTRFALVWVVACFCAPEASAQGVYVIAHMTNSADAIEWAIGDGANGLEVDLQFDANGKATNFFHGDGACDCSCIRRGYGICRAQEGICKASTNAEALLRHISGKKTLALVVIDSKVTDNDSVAKQQQAGVDVVRLLVDNLFKPGYAGKVIISAADLDNTPYLAAAAKAMSASPYQSRVFFAIDGENNVVRTLTRLISDVPSANRVYANGISACIPNHWFDDAALAVKNATAGVLGLVYTWTTDEVNPMEIYLGRGVNGIITNTPSKMVELLKKLKMPLATPKSVIPAAKNNQIVK